MPQGMARRQLCFCYLDPLAWYSRGRVLTILLIRPGLDTNTGSVGGFRRVDGFTLRMV